MRFVGPKAALRWYLRAVGVMDRTTAHVWAGARTVDDLGQLTARWLEGDLPSRPGYAPDRGPENETRALIPSLAAANRAGFITNGSQPGCDGRGYDGAWWQQHAAVEGFTDDAGLARLQRAVEGTGLRLTYGRAHSRRTDYSQALDGMFGAVLSARDIRSMYDECDPDTVETLVGAWQVCVQDPEYGESSRLWEALDRFSGRHEPSQRLAQAHPEARPSPGAPIVPPAAEPTDVAALAACLAGLRDQAAATADALQAFGVRGVVLTSLLTAVEALATAHEAARRAAAGLTR